MKKRKNHVLQKMSSSRLMVSFRNSTMLESTTERLFSVWVCWRKREEKKWEWVCWLVFFVGFREQEEELRETKEEKNEKKKQ
jgi:hypothetical protein